MRKKILFNVLKTIAVVTMLLAFTVCQGPGTTLLDTPDDFTDTETIDSTSSDIRVTVTFDKAITDSIVEELNGYGRVVQTLGRLNTVVMEVGSERLDEVRGLAHVIEANPDALRRVEPVDRVFAGNLSAGLSTWNLDAIDVTDRGMDTRAVTEDGTGVYVAVLDTGLVSTWRDYFPEDRIAEEYAISFAWSGQYPGDVSISNNGWERDTNSHGTHVTSTIIGYKLYENPVNGVAPMATIIPVKVLNNRGIGWSSSVAAGILYVAYLKQIELVDSPVIINMSLSGPVLNALEQAAIDYAITQGVIIVASAGNEGLAGMGYPGAYEPVISVAAAGWSSEWTAPGWWWILDVADPTDTDDFYIAGYSSRALEEQDLDVTAPGSFIVGPYHPFMGLIIEYSYLSGTSMASPHVAGVVALMAQSDPSLTPLEAESIIETTALPFANWTAAEAGSGMINAPDAIEALE